MRRVAPKPSLPRVWMVASSCPSACELSPNVPRRSVPTPVKLKTDGLRGYRPEQYPSAAE
jgi:hypothetical protein